MKVPQIHKKTEYSNVSIEPEIETLDVTVYLKATDIIERIRADLAAIDSRKNPSFPKFALAAVWFLTIISYIAIWHDETIDPGLFKFFETKQIIPLLPVAIFLLSASVFITLYHLTRSLRESWRLRLLVTPLIIKPDLSARYRFERGGITFQYGACVTLTDWSKIDTIDCDDRYARFVSVMTSGQIVLPLRDLATEERERLQQWIDWRKNMREAAWPTTAPRHIPLTPDLATQIGREIDYATTEISEKDFIARIKRITVTPSVVCFSFTQTLIASFRWFMVIPVFFIFYWVIDPFRLPLSVAWPLYVEAVWDNLNISLAMGFGILALNILLYWPANQLHAKKMGQKYFSNLRALALKITWTENGILFQEKYQATFCQWQGMGKIENKPEHWVISVQYGTFIAIPKRNIPLHQRDAFNALLHEQTKRGLSQ